MYHRPTELLFVRVPAEVKKAVHDAAESSGISLSMYIEELVEELERNGGLPIYKHLTDF